MKKIVSLLLSLMLLCACVFSAARAESLSYNPLIEPL